MFDYHQIKRRAIASVFNVIFLHEIIRQLSLIFVQFLVLRIFMTY